MWNEKYAMHEGDSQPLGVVAFAQKAENSPTRVLISIDKDFLVI